MDTLSRGMAQGIGIALEWSIPMKDPRMDLEDGTQFPIRTCLPGRGDDGDDIGFILLLCHSSPCFILESSSSSALAARCVPMSQGICWAYRCGCWTTWWWEKMFVIALSGVWGTRFRWQIKPASSFEDKRDQIRTQP